MLEVRSRKADMIGDRLDRRLIAIALGDELDRALDGGVIRAGGRSAGNVEHVVRKIHCRLSMAEAKGMMISRSGGQRPPENDDTRSP